LANKVPNSFNEYYDYKFNKKGYHLRQPFQY
jgi:hypothetical protein